MPCSFRVLAIVYEVVNGLGLLAIDPASAGGEKELKREEVGHGALYRLGAVAL